MSKKTLPPPPEAPAPQGHRFLSVRVDAAMAARIEALFPMLSSTWHDATTSDALRYVLSEGLDAIDARKALPLHAAPSPPES